MIFNISLLVYDNHKQLKKDISNIFPLIFIGES